MNQYFFNVTKEERENILDKHKTIYDGYVTQYGQSNMTPLTVVDMARDKEGVTVTANGEVKTYRNHNINEIAAKNLHYDEIDAAYDFDSPGPQQNMTQSNPGTKPYEFDSRGPVDSYLGSFYDTTTSNYEPSLDDTHNFEPLLDMEDYLDDNQVEIDGVNESVNKSLDMFKRFQNFN